VKDFYNRVSEVFQDVFLNKPAHVTTHRGTAAKRFDLTDVQAQALMKLGINNMQLLVMNTMFIGGLKEEIRTKVLETGLTQIQESVSLARELEIITKDKKDKVEKGAYINSVQAHPEEAVLPADDIDVLETEHDDVPSIQKFNAIRRLMNKPLLKFKVCPGSKPNPNSRSYNTNVQCHFCKKFGHVQKDCRKCQTAGAPMVDRAGHPFTSSSPPCIPLLLRGVV
jgi:hypothetical protein